MDCLDLAISQGPKSFFALDAGVQLFFRRLSGGKMHQRWTSQWTFVFIYPLLSNNYPSRKLGQCCHHWQEAANCKQNDHSPRTEQFCPSSQARISLTTHQCIQITLFDKDPRELYLLHKVTYRVIAPTLLEHVDIPSWGKRLELHQRAPFDYGECSYATDVLSTSGLLLLFCWDSIITSIICIARFVLWWCHRWVNSCDPLQEVLVLLRILPRVVNLHHALHVRLQAAQL